MKNEDGISNTDNKIPHSHQEGYLYCGCLKDEVLLGLILWKLTVQQSPTTGIKETLQNQFLPFHQHTFFL